VLIVAPECAPFAKTGGLGEVVGALPRALRRCAVEVRVVVPLYAGMPRDELEPLEGILSVPMSQGPTHGRVRLGRLPQTDVPVYFIEDARYFDRPHLYGPPADSYPDNLERFAFLSRGALELTKALAERAADLVGILNGIDTDVGNPATDGHLVASFDARDLSGKARCKAAIQAEAGLSVRADVPHALDTVLEWDVQRILMGSGDRAIEALFASRAAARRDRLHLWTPFDDARSHRLQAGADLFVMPSRFEPCGLAQLYAMRYGTLPIVRATGGLVDTAATYDESTGDGTGFVFHDLRPDSLAHTIGWAVST